MRQHVVVGRRNLAAAHPARHRGALLDGQCVRGNVINASLDRRVDRPPQVVVGLPRRAVDEVDVDVLEARRKRFARRRGRPSRRMHPVQGGQHVRGRRLHAQRHPRVPGGAQPSEQLRRRRLGVGLGGHLCAGRQHEVLADRVEHAGEAFAAQQRRRSAADEHRLHFRSRSADDIRRSRRAQQIGRVAELGAQGDQPAVGIRAAQLGGRISVEIAVSAAGGAERHVNIDAERPAGRRRQAR